MALSSPSPSKLGRLADAAKPEEAGMLRLLVALEIDEEAAAAAAIDKA